MRDQGDFKSGVKRFAYDGGKSNKNAPTDDWDNFTVTKPIKETKEFEELNDVWSNLKSVSLSGGPLKPQGSTVQAPPSGTGFYSRHGQHNSMKMAEGTRLSPSLNTTGQPKSSYMLNSQRSGYSYSQTESSTGSTTFPLLTPAGGGSQYQSESRYSKTTQPGVTHKYLPGDGVTGTRTLLGMQKPSQYSNSPQHTSGNSRTSSGTGNQWPNF